MEEASEMKEEKWVYRISGEAEWEELENKGFTHGGDLDRTTGCIHLSDLNQVKMTLENFFAGRNDLYLLQIDAAKLGEGLVYESADGTNYFPHFYSPERSFVPLQLDTVVKAEKVDLIDGNFNLPTHTLEAAAAATAAAATTTGNPFSCFLFDDDPWDYSFLYDDDPWDFLYDDDPWDFLYDDDPWDFLYDADPWDYANDDINYDRFFNNNDNDDDCHEFRYADDCDNFGFEDYFGSP